MKKKSIRVLAVILVIVLGLAYWVFHLPGVGNPAIPTDAGSVARGAYLYNAAGCASCHQEEGAAGATGGHQLKSPFGGTFSVPNITPDEKTGIGGWTGRDFLRAVKHGRSPGGGFYWPAFPYRSYSNMTDEDVLDVAAYLMSQPAIAHEVPEHDLPGWQFSWMMAGWNKMANLLEGTPAAVAEKPQVQRGAYLARALGHCGECHTPRNSLGMLQQAQEFKGSDIAPDISRQALSEWTEDDFLGLLQLGMTASFDYVGGEMSDVIKHTSQLTEEDQKAYAAFFVGGAE
ncbi:MAG TPA: cytochrome c [Steroidobacteraceae bacterium]|nr:cytochrome c [Steroidobacteraceae bacterium]